MKGCFVSPPAALLRLTVQCFRVILNVCECAEKEERGGLCGTDPLTLLWTDAAETWWNLSGIISVNIWGLSLSDWLSIFGQHKPGLCAQYILIHLKHNQKTNRSHYCGWQLFLFVFPDRRRTKWSAVNSMNQADCRYRCPLFHWGERGILIWGSRRNTNVSVRTAHVVLVRQTAWIKPEAGSWHREERELWGYFMLHTVFQGHVISQRSWLLLTISRFFRFLDVIWPQQTSSAFSEQHSSSSPWEIWWPTATNHQFVKGVRSRPQAAGQVVVVRLWNNSGWQPVFFRKVRGKIKEWCNCTWEADWRGGGMFLML